MCEASYYLMVGHKPLSSPGGDFNSFGDERETKLPRYETGALTPVNF